MKPAIDWLEYQRLELIIPSSSRPQRNRLAWLRIGHVWDALWSQLVRPAEPYIWQTRDAAGEIWWSAHDPETGQSVQYISEDQMRAWVEQRYL